MLGWLSNLFEDGVDSDVSRFEGRDVTKLIIKGIVTLRIPPGKLCSPVNAAGFTWKNKVCRSTRTAIHNLWKSTKMQASHHKVLPSSKDTHWDTHLLLSCQSR